MKTLFVKLLLIAVLIELLIFVSCYFIYESSQEVFRYAARYSGRLSLVVFLITFYQYAITNKTSIAKNIKLKNLLKLFSIVHIIHFGFLATNIYLNKIPLEIPKLIGGALAYLMIVIAPFIFYNISRVWQLIYFYYVAIVMIMTYVARVKGDFEGAEPFWFHYVALGILIFCCFIFGWNIFKKKEPLK